MTEIGQSSSWEMSDHKFVLATLGIIRPTLERKTIKMRNMKKINQVALCEDLKAIVRTCQDIDDPESLFEKYNSCLAQVMDKHAPQYKRN